MVSGTPQLKQTRAAHHTTNGHVLGMSDCSRGVRA